MGDHELFLVFTYPNILENLLKIQNVAYGNPKILHF